MAKGEKNLNKVTFMLRIIRLNGRVEKKSQIRCSNNFL